MNLLAHIEHAFSLLEKDPKLHFKIKLPVDGNLAIPVDISVSSEGHPIVKVNLNECYRKFPKINWAYASLGYTGSRQPDFIFKKVFEKEERYYPPKWPSYRDVFYYLRNIVSAAQGLISYKGTGSKQYDSFHRVYERISSGDPILAYIEKSERNLNDEKLLDYPHYEMVNLHALMSVVGFYCSKIDGVVDILYQFNPDERVRIMNNYVIMASGDYSQEYPHLPSSDPVFILCKGDASLTRERQDLFISQVKKTISDIVSRQHCFYVDSHVTCSPSLWSKWERYDSQNPFKYFLDKRETASDKSIVDYKYAIEAGVITSDDWERVHYS